MQTFEKFIDALISGAETCLEVLSGLVSSVPEKKKGYDSGFAPESSVLSSFNKGFCLTGTKQLTRKDSYMNSMIIGGTGTGKSSVVLIPTILSSQASLVVNDPSGELQSATSGYLHQKGYQVLTLDFADHIKSCGYNPIDFTQTVSEIQKLSTIAVTSSMGNSKEKFWELMSISLMNMGIGIVKTQPPEFQNLYNVRQILNRFGSEPEAVDALFSQFASEELFSEYKSFLAYDEKVIASTVASAKAALQIFFDPEVSKVTSHTTIRFEEFRKRPTVLFIRNKISDSKYYSVITSLFIEQFSAFLLSRFPEKDELDVHLLLDESSSLNLPSLVTLVSNLRKHRASCMLAYQDFNQCISLYGRETAEAIRSNCYARLYLTGQPLDTCKHLSDLLGKYEYEDDQKRKVNRSVMTPDEIRTMSIDRALLICGHHQPVMARLKPYYKQTKYKQYSKIPPFNITRPEIKSVPVLPINYKKTNEQAA